MGNNNFDNPNDQFILSYELLLLMEWMVENDAESLKKFIAKAFKHGFAEKLKEAQKFKDLYSPEELQNSLVDFLGLLEVLLYEVTNEQAVSKVMQKNLMPAIDHVDTLACDSSTVRSSVAIATSKLERNPQENAQELFFRELLKRWKPSKNLTEN